MTTEACPYISERTVPLPAPSARGGRRTRTEFRCLAATIMIGSASKHRFCQGDFTKCPFYRKARQGA